MAALRHLADRQRTVLILRDVLRLSSADVATLLGVTVASVNSSLQRARTSVARIDPVAEGAAVLDDEDRELVAQYVDAFERYDFDALITLLHAAA